MSGEGKTQLLELKVVEYATVAKRRLMGGGVGNKAMGLGTLGLMDTLEML